MEATLFDAIRGHEAHFEEVVSKAIECALISLGDDIYKLEWANLSVGLAALDAAA